MKSFEASNIRNIAVIGHSGEGKTSLCEDILFNSGAIDRIGKIADGNTAMDFEEQEILRKGSISLSIFATEWKGCKLNLIDVPGFADFEGEKVAALHACDSALIVTSTSGTMSVGTEKAIEYCLIQNIPMMIFINGTDKENADYFGTLAAIREKYPKRTAPIQVPIMEGNKMIGYINALSSSAYKFNDKGPQPMEVPVSMKEQLKGVYQHLVEAAAETDDSLMETFFEKGTLSREQVINGVKAGINADSIIPVLGGSAACNKGVFNLMDEIVEILPAPNEKDNGVSSKCPLCVEVFKTIVDPYVGRLNFVKVLSGVLKAGDTTKNVSRGHDERISSLYILRGKKQESVAELVAGDIGAISKLSNTGTGDILGSSTEKTYKINYPTPVYEMAVYAEKSGEEEKIFSGLHKLMDEDLTLKLEKNAQTGETILCGLGELHIDVTLKKLQSKFKVNATVKTPKVAYRETIKKVAICEGKHKKQSGGHGQYGHVKMKFQPCENAEFIFAEEVVGGSVPKNYFPAVEKGIRESICNGVLAGYPVINLKATLLDGSYHDVDSSELAFKMAAALAFKEGMLQASPVLLEPIYQYDITVSENYMGDVMGDINKRRGKILGMDMVDRLQVVHVEAPQVEMFKYATDLRSITQGRGYFTSKFARYDEVPIALLEKIRE